MLLESLLESQGKCEGFSRNVIHTCVSIRPSLRLDWIGLSFCTCVSICLSLRLDWIGLSFYTCVCPSVRLSDWTGSECHLCDRVRSQNLVLHNVRDFLFAPHAQLLPHQNKMAGIDDADADRMPAGFVLTTAPNADSVQQVPQSPFVDTHQPPPGKGRRKEKGKHVYCPPPEGWGIQHNIDGEVFLCIVAVDVTDGHLHHQSTAPSSSNFARCWCKGSSIRRCIVSTAGMPRCA